MNWYIIIPVGIALLALVIFLVRTNQKDEEKFENQLNDEYPKKRGEENDIEVDKQMK